MTAPIRRAAAFSSLSSSRFASDPLEPNGILVARRLSEPSRSERQSISAARQEDPLSEINWAVELRKIEREYDGLPPEPTPGELRQQRDAERRERERQDAVAASFGVYFRLTLVVCLAVCLAAWPFDVTCGGMLLGYLAAIGLLMIVGIWTATATFTHQMPRRHLTALLIICWGITLGAAQILPRIGYAIPAPGRASTWSCPVN